MPDRSSTRPLDKKPHKQSALLRSAVCRRPRKTHWRRSWPGLGWVWRWLQSSELLLRQSAALSTKILVGDASLSPDLLPISVHSDSHSLGYKSRVPSELESPAGLTAKN